MRPSEAVAFTSSRQSLGSICHPLLVVGGRGAEDVRPQQMAGYPRRRLDGEDMLSGDLAALAPVADDVLGNANGGSELSDAASYFDCLG